MGKTSLRARDIMQIEIATILDDASIVEAAHQMRLEGVRSLVVVPHDEGDSFGIITFADIVSKVLAEGRDPRQTRVYQAMTKPAIIIAPDMPVSHIAALFGKFKFGHAPVVDCGKLVGIVSMTDLITELLPEPD